MKMIINVYLYGIDEAVHSWETQDAVHMQRFTEVYIRQRMLNIEQFKWMERKRQQKVHEWINWIWWKMLKTEWNEGRWSAVATPNGSKQEKIIIQCCCTALAEPFLPRHVHRQYISPSCWCMLHTPDCKVLDSLSYTGFDFLVCSNRVIAIHASNKAKCSVWINPLKQFF